jgi:hypothetical protein
VILLCSGILTKLPVDELTLDCDDKAAELFVELGMELCTELTGVDETPMLVAIDDCPLLDVTGVELFDDGDDPDEEPPPPQAVRKVIKKRQTILSLYFFGFIKFPTKFNC